MLHHQQTGFVSHALGIKLENQDVEDRGGFIIDSGDLVLNAIVTEDEKVNVDPAKVPNYNEWEFKDCNDRSCLCLAGYRCLRPRSENLGTAQAMVGAQALQRTRLFTQRQLSYLPEDDKNKDGKIRYYDHETEILGNYDLATGTWDGAFIDARTFKRNNGKYSLKVDTNGDSKTMKGMMTGFDFGGMTQNGAPLPAGLRRPRHQLG